MQQKRKEIMRCEKGKVNFTIQINFYGISLGSVRTYLFSLSTAIPPDCQLPKDTKTNKIKTMMKKIRMKEETVFDDTNSYLLQEENKFLFGTYSFEILHQKKNKGKKLMRHR